MEQNLLRERGKWGRLEKILVREVADKITAGMFYVTVVQVVLMFGSKKWKSLKGFHHRVDLWQAVYNPISSSPTITSSAPMGGYTHIPSH